MPEATVTVMLPAVPVLLVGNESAWELESENVTVPSVVLPWPPIQE